MPRPIKPTLSAGKTEQDLAANAAEQSRYEQEILAASAGDLDSADRVALGKMIATGIATMRANGEIR